MMIDSEKPRAPLKILGILQLLILGCSVAAFGQDVNTNLFVVKTEVFVNEGGTSTPRLAPVTTTETIFRGTEVYDAANGSKNGLAIKMDLDARQVRIVDTKLKLQTALTFREIREFQADICAFAARRNGIVKFMAVPKFDYAFDASTRTIRLKSPWMQYEAVGHRQAPTDVVDRYTEFADWSKQMSSVLFNDPPAQARMRLNKRLKEKSMLAATVTLRIQHKPLRTEATSKHQYSFELTPRQQNFIQLVEGQLDEFKTVPFAAFQKKRKAIRLAASK